VCALKGINVAVEIRLLTCSLHKILQDCITSLIQRDCEVLGMNRASILNYSKVYWFGNWLKYFELGMTIF